MDIGILQWVHEALHGQMWLNYIMKYITYLGEFGLGPILCGAVLLLFKKTRWAGVAIAIAMALDVLTVNILLKSLINRPRPWQTYPDFGFREFHLAIGVREPSDSSFPSGHTAAMFSAAVALVCFYRLKGTPALAVAFLVALSRIYLCMHYPSDVLGGLLIGSVCGVAGYFLTRPLKKFIEKKRGKADPPNEAEEVQKE